MKNKRKGTNEEERYIRKKIREEDKGKKGRRKGRRGKQKKERRQQERK